MSATTAQGEQQQADQERGTWKDRALERARRLLNRFGLGGDTLLVIGKCVLAAGLSWFLAEDLLHAPSATFAPFSAVLIVHGTVSESISHSVRFVAAVIAGVALAGVLLPPLGSGVVVFAVIVLLALVLGQWRRLGSQGVQVAVAAMFAYRSFVQAADWTSSWLQLGSISGLVLLGATVGVLTNLLVMPPLQYRSAEQGVRALARSVSDQLINVADGLREGTPSSDDAEDWSHRVGELPNLVEQTRWNLEHASETLRFNPRRLFMRSSVSFTGYRYTVNALAHVVDQLPPVTRSLTFAADQEEADEHHQRFLQSYAQLLDAVAGATRQFGELHSLQDLREESDLDTYLDRGRRACEQVKQHLDDAGIGEPGQWPAYQALHADARRLVEDITRAQQRLARIAAGEQPSRSNQL